MKSAFAMLMSVALGGLALVGEARAENPFPDYGVQIGHCTTELIPELRIFAFSETEGVVYARLQGMEDPILARADLEFVEAGQAVRVAPRVPMYPAFTVTQGEATTSDILEQSLTCNASW